MFIFEIIQIVQSAGVGTYNANIFGSSKASIPVGDGPFLSVIETGGQTPQRTHNHISLPAVQRPSAQILARAKNYAAAMIMARAAYNALVGIRNQYVTGLALAVTSITRAGDVATVTTTNPHGLFSGTRVVIAGATQTEYNGTFENIIVTGASTFTYIVVGTPASPATGTPLTAKPSTFYQEIEPIQEPQDLQSDSAGRAQVGFNIRTKKQPS